MLQLYESAILRSLRRPPGPEKFRDSLRLPRPWERIIKKNTSRVATSGRHNHVSLFADMRSRVSIRTDAHVYSP